MRRENETNTASNANTGNQETNDNEEANDDLGDRKSEGKIRYTRMSGIFFLQNVTWIIKIGKIDGSRIQFS